MRTWERSFAILALLSSMGVIAALTDPGHSDRSVAAADLHLPAIALEGILNLWGGILVLRRGRQVLRAARSVWPLVALSALAVLSTTWSVQPLLTLRRSALLLTSTAIAIYLGERYSMEELAQLLARAMCLMILGVIAFRLLAPTYIIDPFGAWKGLSGYKNAFGECMAVAVILLSLVRLRHGLWLRLLFWTAAAVLLVLSHSATAILVGGVVLGTLPLWRLARLGVQQGLGYAIPALALPLGIYLLRNHTDLLLQILGRDATLSGRIPLWSTVLAAVLRHPIVGYGYGAFWNGLQGEALEVWIKAGWLAPRADNGYLDLCLNLGVVGLVILGMFLARCFKRAVHWVRAERRPIGLWPISYLCFFALHGVSESTLLTSGDFSFLVFAAIATSLMLRDGRDAAVLHSAVSPPRMRDGCRGLSPANCRENWVSSSAHGL